MIYIIKKIGEKLEEMKKHQKITEKEIVTILEADELFTYMGRKKIKSGCGRW